MERLTADFETTTDTSDCRVWAWATCTIDERYELTFGTSIDSFLREMAHTPAREVWFHNLAFDGNFIVDKLMRLGYEWTPAKVPARGQFATLVSNRGKFYQVQVTFYNGKRVAFKDSLKVYPLSVASIAKVFEFPEQKGEIDYKLMRPKGHALTPEEKDYISRDVLITAKAMKHMFDEKLEKMTAGSNAFNFFKTTCTNFDRLFPVCEPTLDALMRHGYRGGFTYLMPQHAEKTIGPGISVDYNSMYPSQLIMRPMPYGTPKVCEGRLQPTTDYPLYMQTITCMFHVKQ